jgi:hypothetical protein
MIEVAGAALAKAQAQLVNPEKSLMRILRSDQAGGSNGSFGYARCRDRRPTRDRHCANHVLTSLLALSGSF